MLDRIQVIELLHKATEDYIRALDINDLGFAEHKAQIVAYLKVLDNEAIADKYKYVDIDKAKDLLKDIKANMI